MSELLEEQEGRQELITAIIQAALDNPLMDNTYVALLFKELSGEILVFERTGIELIQGKMQALIDADHPLKAVLLSYIDPEETITAQQAIGSYFNA